MMRKYTYEAILSNIKKEDSYDFFMKFSYKYKKEEKIARKLKKNGAEANKRIIETLERDFSFFDIKIHQKIKSNIKYSEYPLEFYKCYKKPQNANSEIILHDISKKEIDRLNTLSGIMTFEKLKEYVDSLIPGSFGVQQTFEMDAPYFSRDDEALYIIDNPVLKEKVYKAPMIKGSMWKGVLLQAANAELNDMVENSDIDIAGIIDTYRKIYRIFGAGSQDFRGLIENLKKRMKTDSPKLMEEYTEQLVRYALFDLGISLNIDRKNGKLLFDQLIEHIEREIERKKILNLCVHKGRAIFYPTYFNQIALEVLNPHNKKRKAGTQPIYFEVVPKGRIGILQIIYIPFDAFLMTDAEIKKQSENDRRFIEKLIDRAVTRQGIGAKTKLGWGIAKLKQKQVWPFEEVEQNG